MRYLLLISKERFLSLKWKSKPYTGRNYLQNIYPTKLVCSKMYKEHLLLNSKTTIQFLK